MTQSKSNKVFGILCLLTVVFSGLKGQEQTVGLFEFDEEAFDGYTLLAPSTKEAYLIDNCGNWVHKWTTNYVPGASTYLLENGNLLRTCRVPGTFNGGGSGGRVELYDWDSNLVWGYTFSEANSYHQHHDVEFLPNGNILVLAWEEFSEAQMIAEGRLVDAVTDNGIWLEKVIEAKPIGADDIEIVWEWRAIDHLVQDVNPIANNYGIIADHPERINLNFFRSGNIETSADYMHANAIDYNADLDQILISSRNFSEIWVIDHSTSTAEAATASGGVFGNGGNLLYRYGNPRTYDRGTEADQKFFGQHDVKWISIGDQFKGMISVFNNGDGRPDGPYSTVDIIQPPLDAEGNYQLAENLAYGPEEISYSFGSNDELNVFSPRTSGAMTLPNDNIMVCEGSSGVLYEITSSGEIVWHYANPVSINGIATQGELTGNLGVFRAEKYGYDYPAFEGKTLSSNGPLELDPIDQPCMLVNTVDIVKSTVIMNTNWDEYLHVTGVEDYGAELVIVDNLGREILNKALTWDTSVDVSILKSGIYYVLLRKQGQVVEVRKAIKQ